MPASCTFNASLAQSNCPASPIPVLQSCKITVLSKSPYYKATSRAKETAGNKQQTPPQHMLQFRPPNTKYLHQKITHHIIVHSMAAMQLSAMQQPAMQQPGLGNYAVCQDAASSDAVCQDAYATEQQCCMPKPSRQRHSDKDATSKMGHSVTLPVWRLISGTSSS